jgi:hypothetical protein
VSSLYGTVNRGSEALGAVIRGALASVLGFVQLTI